MYFPLKMGHPTSLTYALPRLHRRTARSFSSWVNPPGPLAGGSLPSPRRLVLRSSLPCHPQSSFFLSLTAPGRVPWKPATGSGYCSSWSPPRSPPASKELADPPMALCYGVISLPDQLMGLPGHCWVVQYHRWFGQGLYSGLEPTQLLADVSQLCLRQLPFESFHQLGKLPFSVQCGPQGLRRASPFNSLLFQEYCHFPKCVPADVNLPDAFNFHQGRCLPSPW
jgi:hypothetical protein